MQILLDTKMAPSRLEKFEVLNITKEKVSIRKIHTEEKHRNHKKRTEPEYKHRKREPEKEIPRCTEYLS